MIINPITLLIGAIFAPLASLMAYHITYNEYQYHYPDKATPKKLALETALLTFTIFMIISFMVGLFISKMVAN